MGPTGIYETLRAQDKGREDFNESIEEPNSSVIDSQEDEPIYVVLDVD